ncbi:MAG TPA: hypothetical protein VJZ93_01870 [Candidatus Nanoarchaeia archaeon]|nr:hypothetical protein [Candidatus Nanoarchaeia archaeon]
MKESNLVREMASEQLKMLFVPGLFLKKINEMVREDNKSKIFSDPDCHPLEDKIFMYTLGLFGESMKLMAYSIPLLKGASHYLYS